MDYFKKSIEEYYNKGFQEWFKLWKEWSNVKFNIINDTLPY